MPRKGDFPYERCARWVRLYNSAADVGEELDIHPKSVMRAVNRFPGLAFRLSRSLAEDPRSDGMYLK